MSGEPGFNTLGPVICFRSPAVLGSGLCMHQVWDYGFKKGLAARFQLWAGIRGVGHWGLFWGLSHSFSCKGYLSLASEGDNMCCSFAVPLNRFYLKFAQ